MQSKHRSQYVLLFRELGHGLSKGTVSGSCCLFLPISVFFYHALLVLELPWVNRDTVLWGLKSGGPGTRYPRVSTTYALALQRERRVGKVRIRARWGRLKDGEGGRFRVLHHLQWQLHTEGSKVHVHLPSSTLSSRLPASGHLADVWPSPSINPEQLATIQCERLCF